MRILLIEDDKRLAALIHSVLDQENFSVDVANDGDTGLELAYMILSPIMLVI